MDNLAVFHKAVSTLEREQPIGLVTVIAATGSTPGKVGYKMLVLGDNAGTVGTVGGGLLESRMIDEARRMLSQPRSCVFHFELGETPDDEKGICGGAVEFLIETFDGTALPLFRELSTAVADGRGGVLVSILSPDGVPRKFHLQGVEQMEAGGIQFSPEIATAIRDAGASGETGRKVSAGTMDVFLESLSVRPEVVLFGAGHLSYHIARLAKSVHFRVTVCDDRSEYANRQRFPDADEIVVEDIARVFDRVRISEDSYLVIVTRGHKCDEIVLEQAVRTKARYIGMIGSKRKTLLLLEKLADKGVPKDLLDRVYSPVGISIGALTPEEIALSIVCELVKVRRVGDEPAVGHMTISRHGGAP